MKLHRYCSVLSLVALTPTWVLADNTSHASGHAPIGVMGDHMHKKGEWMVSYRFMSMDMQDNLQGSDSIDPQTIVTSIPNRFANPPTMPPTLRVVPTDMQTTMHMVGVMYAPTDDITLMGMFNWVKKDMDHLTFAGGMGTEVLGTFTTETSGVGDTKLGLLYRLYEQDGHKIHANFTVSAPTGDIEQTDQILTPMGMMPTVRLPYPMQLGSGTWDIEPGVTYTGFEQLWSWGLQAKYLSRLSDNDEGYTLGDQLSLSGWASYALSDHLSTSLRLFYRDLDSIDSMDPNIMLPVQTADPDNSGETRLDLAWGINAVLTGGHRIALEYQHTLDQDVNGVQMEMKNMLTLGYQYAF